MQRPSLYVFPSKRHADEPVNVEHLADDLRTWLAKAGVDRPQLSEDNDVRRHVVAHDTRASFVTIHLAAGKSEHWIMSRTGHTTSFMLQKYRRVALNLGENETVALPPLNLAVPELVFSATET